MSSLFLNNRSRSKNSRGSGTAYINIDLNLLRSFDDFMEDEFFISKSLSEKLLSKEFFLKLKTNQNLTINHDFRSDYQYKTGFNWNDRYL